MKTEDRILELLAEYLKKTDQSLERIDLAYTVLMKHSGQFEQHSGQFEQHSGQFEQHSKQFEQHSKQFAQHSKQFEQHSKQFAQHSDQLMKQSERIEELRKESLKHQVQQEALLKEIFSISRRVSNLEDNT